MRTLNYAARGVDEATDVLAFPIDDQPHETGPRELGDVFVCPEKVNSYFERGTIEVAPLAFMRGRTLNDSFVILDEAQNTSPEQMKMFLTRLGFGSKIVVTGDITQIDLERGSKSGLVEVGAILNEVQDINFIRFGGEDVVRHKLVQRIVAAYGEAESRSASDGDG